MGRAARYSHSSMTETCADVWRARQEPSFLQRGEFIYVIHLGIFIDYYYKRVFRRLSKSQ